MLECFSLTRTVFISQSFSGKIVTKLMLQVQPQHYGSVFCEWYCHMVLGLSNIWSHCFWLCTSRRLINMNEKLIDKVSFTFMDMELKCKDSDSSHFLIEKLLEAPFGVHCVFLLITHSNPVSVGTSVSCLK